MSYISGILGEDSRIILYDTVQNALIYDEIVVAGAYSIDNLSGSTKHIMAVSESTGEAIAYGEVIPAGFPVLLVDNFDGLALDTGNWTVSTEPNGSVSVNEELRLNCATGGTIRSGGHVRTVDSWNKSLAYEIQVKWKPNTNHYGSAHHPYIAFVNSGGYSTNDYEAPESNRLMMRLGEKYDSTQRTEISLEGFSEGQELAVGAININESLWHDLVFTYTPSDRTASVRLNGSLIINVGQGGIPSNSGWSGIRVMMGNCDYNKTNTERFDDFVLNYA